MHCIQLLWIWYKEIHYIVNLYIFIIISFSGLIGKGSFILSTACDIIWNKWLQLDIVSFYTLPGFCFKYQQSGEQHLKSILKNSFDMSPHFYQKKWSRMKHISYGDL